MTDTLGNPMTGTPAEAPPGRRTPPAWLRLVGMTAGLGAVLVLLLAVFIMPSLKSGPHDLPIGVVGSGPSTAPLEAALTEADAEAYEIERFDSVADLTDAVRGREVVGGFAVDERGLTAVVASAGSTAISSTLTATATAVGEATSTEVSVSDVVALPAADPTGIGIGGLAFPLVFGGIVPAVAFRAVFPRSHRWRLAGILTFSVVGGLVVAAVLRFVFGSIESGLLPVAAAMALGIAALSVPLAGLQQAVGTKGFTACAMVMMFLGNPLAGIATTSAWLPAGLGTVGQLLPPGAAGTLVRSVAYFDGAGGLTAALTLATWLLLGLALYAVGARRGRLSAAPIAPIDAGCASVDDVEGTATPSWPRK